MTGGPRVEGGSSVVPLALGANSTATGRKHHFLRACLDINANLWYVDVLVYMQSEERIDVIVKTQ